MAPEPDPDPSTSPDPDPAPDPDPDASHLLRIDSPLGRIQLTGTSTAVDGLALESGGVLPLDHLPERPSQLLHNAARQLERYFAGSTDRFTVPLASSGTAFQCDVWRVLRALDWGEVITYGDIGRLLGRPSAGRAVGAAVRANPLPIIVGCHRVLGSGGTVTGYSQGAGIATKVWLLEHEGVAHASVSGQGAQRS